MVHEAHMLAYKAHQEAIRAADDEDNLKELDQESQATAEASVAKAREVEGVTADIESIKTARLNRKLLRRGLDLPDSDWYRTVNHVKRPWGAQSVSYLTEYGESKVRRALKRDRREAWEFRLKVIAPLITGLTGLIGVLIGFLSSDRVVPALKDLIRRLFG